MTHADHVIKKWPFCTAIEAPNCPHCGSFTRLSYIEPDTVETQVVMCVYECMCGAALTRPYGARV